MLQRVTSLGYQPTNEVRQGYTGYEQDTESGLDFAQARYYNSAHGRFTSADPLTASANLKNPQTFNRYSYVLNSPYKYSDPLGLISQNTGACGSRCVNSGGYLDGSAFRGRDASFEWALFNTDSAQERPDQQARNAAPNNFRHGTDSIYSAREYSVVPQISSAVNNTYQYNVESFSSSVDSPTEPLSDGLAVLPSLNFVGENEGVVAGDLEELSISGDELSGSLGGDPTSIEISKQYSGNLISLQAIILKRKIIQRGETEVSDGSMPSESSPIVKKITARFRYNGDSKTFVITMKSWVDDNGDAQFTYSFKEIPQVRGKRSNSRGNPGF